MRNSISMSVIILLILSFFSTCKTPVEVDLYGDISGTVTDALSKAPLEGAIVTLSPSSASTQTGSDGKYSFTKLDPKEYEIQVTIEGYTTNTKNLTVKAGENTSGDISLTALQPVLDVSEMNLDFGEDQTQLALVISNTGKGDLNWNVVESIPWLSVNPTSGKTTVQKSSVVLTVDRTGLSVGNNSQLISIVSNGGTKMISVSMIVADQLSAKVTTGSALNVSQTTANITGNILSLGVGSVLKYGHCYSTLPNPTISDAKTDLGTLTAPGAFTSSLSGLEKSTTYFVRAYATNSIGTGYSTQVTFTTSESPTLPNVTIQDASSITFNSASVVGGIASLGNSNITQYGHCWAVNTNPTTSDSKTTLGSKTIIGSYSSNLASLLPGTTYYVKGYAINNAGTAYSTEISFTTKPTPVPPSVTTGAVSNITFTGAQVAGNITDFGTSNITQHGHCWSTSVNPTISDTKTQLGVRTSVGAFTSTISSLQPGTTYYIRAYAVNSDGTSYGSQVEFSTVSPTIATLGTSDASNVTSNSATYYGNITNLGGDGVTVTEYGFCYSTAINPTVANTKLVSGSNKTTVGTFTSNASGLSKYTTYYVRAYAINSAGTAYGNQISFTTLATLPVLTTTAVTSITNTTAIGGGEITNDGGASVTDRGVCWSITTAPTINNSKTSDGTGTGVFSSSLIGLSDNTTYYVRAYATNSAGTAYGNELSFNTPQAGSGTVTDIDGNVYHYVTIGPQVWMVENLRTTKFRDGTTIPLVTNNTTWRNLTTPGYCWYNHDEASYKNIYGALYNWYAINTGKLAPVGWHVPSVDDWQVLIDFLGGENVAGGKLKETGTAHWLSPNTGATNEKGFTALPGGHRYDLYGDLNFRNIGYQGYWWSSNYSNAHMHFYLSYNSSYLSWEPYDQNKTNGLSVRCVRD